MSDQDFFFDEDEKPASKAAEKTQKPAAKPAASKNAPAKAGASSAAPTGGGIELTWTVTALIAVVTLLLGVIVGYAIPKGSTVDTGTTGLTGTSGQQAPQLSPEQLQSGTLPEGHPNIGGTGGSTGTTGSAVTTGN